MTTKENAVILFYYIRDERSPNIISPTKYACVVKPQNNN